VENKKFIFKKIREKIIFKILKFAEKLRKICDEKKILKNKNSRKIFKFIFKNCEKIFLKMKILRKKK